MLKWQVALECKLVFLVVYKEILQLAYVEQFLDLLSKTFIGSVYQNLVKKGDVFQTLDVVGQHDQFIAAYNVVFNKWDSIVKQ